MIARYAREIKAESAASRYSREDFLDDHKGDNYPEDIPLQKVTPDAFGEWLSRSRVKWARLLSDGMQWMQDHRELLVKWRWDEGLSYKSIKGREQVEFAGRSAELNHLAVTGTTPQGQPISLDFWVDDHRKLIKMSVPSQGVEAYQEGFAPSLPSQSKSSPAAAARLEVPKGD